MPTQLLWRTVAERLVALISGQAVPVATEVAVELVLRPSSGPARNR